ncbi:cell wall-binding repeat-containing protein [Salisediminibacterium beveridgei]|uniref:Amidase enhancer n=1 Tax=Salisediminibacterium beveridgei TaxID=632773 RepID=A0A1D7QRQ7_9BACI|nr:cell wall-binding repeat-containing protein [Salisediminibacterium beveridgei]AOM81697.1 Amidase enhancer [Salisediminibacterium beveridgei]
MKKVAIYFLIVVLVFTSFSFMDDNGTHASSNQEVTVELIGDFSNQSRLTLKLEGSDYKSGVSSSVDNKINDAEIVEVVRNGSKLDVFADSDKVISETQKFVLKPDKTDDGLVSVNNTKKYRGTLEFTQSSGHVKATNIVPLEEYIMGVVPAEMPTYWHEEALKVQAVAARTFVAGRDFSVVDTTSDQVYNGYVSTNRSKVEGVVNATAGEVVKQDNGRLASTFYSASNGGHTEQNSNLWTGGSPISYLPAQKDPYDQDYSWDLKIHGQQIDLSGRDLTRPGDWWSSVSEEDSKVAPNLRNWLVGEGQASRASDVKIIAVDRLGFSSERTSGQRIKDGFLEVRYIKRDGSGYETNSDGSIRILTHSSDTLTGGGLRLAIGNGMMRSLLVNDVNTSSAGSVNRIEGRTRIDTAIQVANQLYPGGFPADHDEKTVFVTTSHEFADALSAAPLAAELDHAPILLSGASSLSNSVRDEIDRLGAEKVIMLGGTVALSDQVESSLQSISSVNEVERIQGANRYETNRKINEKLTDVNGTFIASGQNFADALGAASVAAVEGYAMVLTHPDSASATAVDFLDDHSEKDSYILGGPVAIGESTGNTLANHVSHVERIAGDNRYDTAAQVLNKFQSSFDTDRIFLTTGQDFPDALAASSLASKYQAPMAIGFRNVNDTMASFLTRYSNANHVQVLGGPVAFSDEAVDNFARSIGLNESYQMSGKGFGHGIGMSQHGANNRANADQGYEDILGFYYPGTSIEQH